MHSSHTQNPMKWLGSCMAKTNVFVWKASQLAMLKDFKS